jgi:hypothetical protein
VKIFPNPASQFITIQLNETYLSEKIENIKIIDNLGKILMDLNIDNFKSTIQLPISNLSIGAYLLVVQSGEKLSIQQFIKK